MVKPACVLPGGFDQPAELVAVGRVRRIGSSRAGADRVDGGLELRPRRRPARRGVAGRRRAPRSARRGRRPLRPERPARAAIASGARGRIASIVCGSIVALVSAWGTPITRTSVLADRVVEREAGAVDRVARRAATRARARRGRARPVPGRARGDQLGAAQRRQRRDRVGERPVERPRRRARARSSRSPAGGRSARSVIGSGSAITSAGRTSRGASWPSGSRWIRSSRRPRGWSGSPRPGPRVRRRSPWRRRSRGRRRARRASAWRRRRGARPRPRRPGRGRRGGRRRLVRRAPAGPRSAPAGVVSSSKRVPALVARANSSASASAPPRKTTRRSPSRQVNSRPFGRSERSVMPEPAPGFEPGNLLLTREVLCQLSYRRAGPDRG